MAPIVDRQRLTVNLLIGLPVMLVATWFICTNPRHLPVLIASTFFFIACLTDTLYTKIPNLLNLSLLLTGFIYNACTTGWHGMVHALLGAMAGLALFLLPYALGMGAGDVKAMSALGALIGPGGIFQVFLYTAVIGGVMAIIYYCLTTDLRQQSLAAALKLQVFIDTRNLQALKPDPKRNRKSFPYVAAIALGFFAFIHWGPIVELLEQWQA